MAKKNGTSFDFDKWLSNFTPPERESAQSTRSAPAESPSSSGGASDKKSGTSFDFDKSLSNFTPPEGAGGKPNFRKLREGHGPGIPPETHNRDFAAESLQRAQQQTAQARQRAQVRAERGKAPKNPGITIQVGNQKIPVVPKDGQPPLPQGPQEVIALDGGIEMPQQDPLPQAPDESGDEVPEAEVSGAMEALVGTDTDRLLQIAADPTAEPASQIAASRLARASRGEVETPENPGFGDLQQGRPVRGTRAFTTNLMQSLIPVAPPEVAKHFEKVAQRQPGSGAAGFAGTVVGTAAASSLSFLNPAVMGTVVMTAFGSSGADQKLEETGSVMAALGAGVFEAGMEGLGLGVQVKIGKPMAAAMGRYISEGRIGDAAKLAAGVFGNANLEGLEEWMTLFSTELNDAVWTDKTFEEAIENIKANSAETYALGAAAGGLIEAPASVAAEVSRQRTEKKRRQVKTAYDELTAAEDAATVTGADTLGPQVTEEVNDGRQEATPEEAARSVQGQQQESQRAGRAEQAELDGPQKEGLDGLQEEGQELLTESELLALGRLGVTEKELAETPAAELRQRIAQATTQTKETTDVRQQEEDGLREAVPEREEGQPRTLEDGSVVPEGQQDRGPVEGQGERPSGVPEREGQEVRRYGKGGVVVGEVGDTRPFGRELMEITEVRRTEEGLAYEIWQGREKAGYRVIDEDSGNIVGLGTGNSRDQIIKWIDPQREVFAEEDTYVGEVPQAEGPLPEERDVEGRSPDEGGQGLRIQEGEGQEASVEQSTKEDVDPLDIATDELEAAEQELKNARGTDAERAAQEKYDASLEAFERERAAAESGEPTSKATDTGRPPETPGEVAGARELGRESTLHTADRKSRPVRYALVEADQITTSHDPTRNFAQNEGGDLNERAYHDPVEGRPFREMVQRISDNPQPERILTDSPSPTEGPPIMTPRGRVLGGNARSMGMQLAYSKGGESAEKFRRAVQEAAERFGVSREAVGEMQSPMIVRVLGSEGEAGEMSRILNESLAAARPESTDSVSRGRNVSDHTAKMAGDMMAPDESGEAPSLRQVMGDPKTANDLLRRLVQDGAWTEADIDRFYDQQNDKLTESGKQAVEGTLLGAIIDDSSVMSRMKPAVSNKMLAAIGPMYEAVNSDMGGWFRGKLKQAVEAHSAWKSSGDTFRDYFFDQMKLEPAPGQGDHVVAAIAHGMDTMTQKKFRQSMRDLLPDLGVRQGDMLPGMEPETSGTVPPESVVRTFAPDVNMPEADFRGEWEAQQGEAGAESPGTAVTPEAAPEASEAEGAQPPTVEDEAGEAPPAETTPEGEAPEAPSDTDAPIREAMAPFDGNLSRMRGKDNQSGRQDILEAVTGERPPKNKAGINRVREALAEYLGIENESRAGEDAKIKSWFNEEAGGEAAGESPSGPISQGAAGDTFSGQVPNSARAGQGPVQPVASQELNPAGYHGPSDIVDSERDSKSIDAIRDKDIRKAAKRAQKKGQKLENRLQKDTEGKKYGLRHIVDYLNEAGKVEMRVGSEQVTRRNPAHYHGGGKGSAKQLEGTVGPHLVRTKSGNSPINIHEFGHALAVDLGKVDDAYGAILNDMSAELIALTEMEGANASAQTEHEGFAEFVRLYVTNPRVLDKSFRETMEKRIRQATPHLAVALEEAHRAWHAHISRTDEAVDRSHGLKPRPVTTQDAAGEAKSSITQAWRTLLYNTTNAETALLNVQEDVIREAKKWGNQAMKNVDEHLQTMRAAGHLLWHIPMDANRAVVGDPKSEVHGISAIAFDGGFDSMSDGDYAMLEEAFARSLLRRIPENELKPVLNRVAEVAEQTGDPRAAHDVVVQELESRGIDATLPGNPGHGNRMRLGDFTLNDIAADVGKDDWDDFKQYAKRKAALARWDKKQLDYPGRDAGTSPEDLRRMVEKAEKAHPEWNDQARRLEEYMNRMLLLSVLSGEITPQEYGLIVEAYDYYTPLRRAVERGQERMGAGAGGLWSGLSGARGSSLGIEDIEKGIRQRVKASFNAYYQNAMRNEIKRVQREISRLADEGKVPVQAAREMQRVSVSLRLDQKKVATLSPGEQKEFIADAMNRQAAVDIGLPEDAVDQLPKEDVTTADDIELSLPGRPIFRAVAPNARHVIMRWDGGDVKYEQIEDPILYKFLSQMESPVQWINWLSESVKGAVDPWKQSITHSIPFAIRAPFRDVFGNVVLGEGPESLVLGIYWANGVLNQIAPEPGTKNPTENLSNAMEISTSRDQRLLVSRFSRVMGEGIVVPGYFSEMGWQDRIKLAPGQLSAAFHKPFEITRWASGVRAAAQKLETIPREGAARMSKRKGESDMMAIYKADKISGNFIARPGNATWASFVRALGFVSPGIQVMTQIYEQATSQRTRGFFWAIKIPYLSAFGASIAATTIMFLDEDEREQVKEIPEEEALQYMPVKIPGLPMFRMPMPNGPEGAAVSMGYNFMMEQLNGGRAIDNSEKAKFVLKRIFDLPGFADLMTPFGKTALEAKTNFSFWYDDAIIPPHMRTYYRGSPEQQVYDSTPEIYRRLGEILDTSPIMVDYVVGNLVGTQVDETLQAADLFLREGEKFPNGISDVPGIGPLFWRPLVGYNSRSIRELSEVAQDYRMAKKAYEQLSEADAGPGKIYEVQEKMWRLERSYEAFKRIKRRMKRVRELQRHGGNEDRVNHIKRELVKEAREALAEADFQASSGR